MAAAIAATAAAGVLGLTGILYSKNGEVNTTGSVSDTILQLRNVSGGLVYVYNKMLTMENTVNKLRADLEDDPFRSQQGKNTAEMNDMRSNIEDLATAVSHIADILLEVIPEDERGGKLKKLLNKSKNRRASKYESSDSESSDEETRYKSRRRKKQIPDKKKKKSRRHESSSSEEDSDDEEEIIRKMRR